MWTGPDERGRLAKSLLKLVEQVDRLVPQRSRSTDGSIGDAAHASRSSDHNPNAAKVVRAVDLTHDPRNGFDSYKFAELLRVKRPTQVRYVISNGRIWGDEGYCEANGGTPFIWQNYTGSNSHSKHVHISVDKGAESYDDPKDWDLSGFTAQPITSAPEVLPRISLGSEGPAVIAAQTALKIKADGIFGEETDRAVRAFQAKAGIDVDGWIGPYTWSALGIMAHSVRGTPQTNIIATWFGGTSDPNYSAYDETDFISDDELGVALPKRFKGTRPKLWVRGPNGKTIENIPIVDVGPIYPHKDRGPEDPYWETGSRPRADTNSVLSGAGIDLTPKLAELVGIKTIGKGLVDWGFMELPMIDTTQPPIVVPPSSGSITTPVPSPTQPGSGSPDLGLLLGTALTTLVVPWLQSRLEGKKPEFQPQALGNLLVLALPLLLGLLKPRTDGSSPLAELLAGFAGATAIEAAKPKLSPIDKAIGGEAMVGLKTPIGVVGTLAAVGLQLAGVMAPITTGGATPILSTLIPLGLSVLGVLAKMDRR